MSFLDDILQENCVKLNYIDVQKPYLKPRDDYIRNFVHFKQFTRKEKSNIFKKPTIFLTFPHLF